VRTAGNGLEALFGAYEMQPAVILMDMTMPVLDGIEATRLIKATKATRNARVIAYTANPPLADVLARRLFVAVLPKPSTPDVVLAAVQNVARS
jgi:CheY-like chemotaxis protein